MTEKNSRALSDAIESAVIRALSKAKIVVKLLPAKPYRQLNCVGTTTCKISFETK